VRTSSGSTVIHQDGKTGKKQSGGEGKGCKCGNAEGIEATGERNDRMIVSSVGSSGGLEVAGRMGGFRLAGVSRTLKRVNSTARGTAPELRAAYLLCAQDHASRVVSAEGIARSKGSILQPFGNHPR